jgi:hypothetical protein
LYVWKSSTFKRYANTKYKATDTKKRAGAFRLSFHFTPTFAESNFQADADQHDPLITQ